MTAFLPSTAEGRQWLAHAEACDDCNSRASVRDAVCEEGQALRDAYVRSLGRPQGNQRSVLE